VSYTIQQITDAVLYALNPLKTGPPGGYIKTIKAYQGDFEVTDDFADLIAICPAALINFDGSSYEAGESQSYERTMNFYVLLGSKNLRGKNERSREVWKMIEDVNGLLNGRLLKDPDNAALELDTNVMKCLGERSLADVKEAVVYSVEYQISMEHYAPPLP